MRSLQLALLGFLLFAGFGMAAADEPRPFVHKEVAQDADRYETYIRQTWQPDSRKAPDVRLAADKLMGPDPRAAARNYAIAVATDAKSPESWLGLAKALLAVKPDPEKSETYDLPVNASGAAYRAYKLTSDTAMQARALAVLGEAMQRRSYWRPAIDALKASLALVDAADVRDGYEKLRAEHGFRMTDYSTDADAATPRVCVQFSENLSRGQVDFAKFVAVNGRDPQSVNVEGSQLCIDGVVHGERYEIQIRAGLPSDVNEPLAKQVTLAVYVPDRKPMVHFTGKSYVLPTRGQQGIPLVAVNTSKVNVEVYRIGDRSLANALNNGDLDRQMQGYQLEELKSRTGSLVYTGELEIPSKLNTEVTAAFPVSEAIGELKPGAYAMIAHPAEQASTESWREQATQWFIVSDLGLTAFSGTDGVHAFVRSLSSADPIANASVRLVARNNEVLATATTDANGYVRFEPGQSRGEGGNAPAILVAENGAGEYAFLDLSSNAFDLSDRGVKGRDAPGPLDGYLYTERGVYRPGEEINVTAIVRDSAGVAASLPVTLIVVRPDGVEQGRYALTDDELGGRTLHLPLGGGAMTGTWRAKLHADPNADPLTQVTFLVEDYVPERLDLTLTEGAGKLAPNETKTIDVTGRFLYGPPAAGMALEGDIVVKPSAKDLAGFEGYRFGDANETVSPVRQPLESLPLTGGDGKAALAIALPAVTRTAKPLEANVIVRLREDGGRTIERSITLPVSLGELRIGIKPLFDPYALGEGEKATFEAVLLDADGKPTTASLDWNLVRLDSSWQWYSRDGYWTYESQTITRKIANGKADATAGAPATISADVDYGRYRLEVSSADTGGILSSVEFSAGWYTSGETADSPEMLDVALDKASYQPGETAKLRIASKHGGKALVTVLGNGLLSYKEVELAKGGGDVDITVGSDWGPGAYATALLYRPMDEAAKRMPSRAIGVRWIGVDQASRTLRVSVATEARIKGASDLSIPVKVEGLSPGEEARITVAAVDVGILNLTRYQVPAPEAHFYAQQKLGLELRDFYGRLIDGMRAERGKLRSGGDGMETAGIEGSPPVEETVAYYSGIVKVGADGTANVSFALPSFNGTVRVMAVAWSKDKLGHGTSDVIVRDSLALTASAPRFLTLGDEAIVDLSLHNVDGAAGAYTAKLIDQTEAETALAEKTVELAAGERKSDEVTFKPAEVGLRTYDVRIAGPGDLSVSRRLLIDVKPPAGDIKRTTVASLAAKGGKLTLSKDLLAGLIKNRTRVNVSVGPAARMDVPGLLTALDRYPYGCAEQTVSRALPLLYANAVAARIGIGADKELKERVQGAIARVFDMQDSSGAFGAWGPGNVDLWLTSYVTDFLTRAREAGYDVRQLPFNQALDRLQNFALNGEDFTSGGEDRAYALYVLARNGRAPVGELRYYADTRLDRFTTPLGKAQIGAALAMVGDKERAETAFAAALDAFKDTEQLRLARYDYGSDIRDGAALVTLASETGIVKTETPRLVDVVAKAYTSRSYTSTQEQAWMLLAAHALGEQASSAKLIVDGAPVADGSLIRALSAEEVEKGIVITNDGDQPTDAVVSVIGASLTPEPAVSKGFKVERSYYTLDGKPVDLASATGGRSEIVQNERLVAVVRIESDEAAGRVLLVDRLPAGLEIENPRLVDSGDIKTIDWLKTTLRPDHTEFRDDRFVAAFNLWGQESSSPSSDNSDDSTANEEGTDATTTGDKAAASATVAYIVRAVTPGTFVHPAATVEDMYRPERYARSGAGTLVISAKD
ncbi:MAG: alpha-2-macroglobulin [Hyphomicrobium sp.]